MNYKQYREGLLKIVNKYSKEPDIMVKKIIDYYQKNWDNNRCFSRLTSKKLHEIEIKEKDNLSDDLKLLIQIKKNNM